MSFAIIVPVRKGSKSLKNKNLVKIRNIPLVEYTFRSLKGISTDKFVLTNDNRIKKISKKYGFNSEYIRPEKVSKDNSSLVDTLLNFFDWLKKNDRSDIKHFVILQATSPLRNVKHVKDAIKMYKKKNYQSLFSISESVEHPYEVISKRKNNWKYLLPKAKKFYRRQDFDIKTFFINGAIYIINCSFLYKNKKLVSKKHGLFLMNKNYSLDINDRDDIEIAKKLI